MTNEPITTPSHVARIVERVRAELARVIVGQDAVVEELLIGLFASGHVLLIGVPGLAKTLLVRTIADLLELHFNRIQFTPDLMPSDITGTEILEETADHRRAFRFLKGPVFANIVLADEINRTPPKTQAALLQAMQELQVTAGGHTHRIDPPFYVLATQNPIEQEGTYPLPEAQLDRFMLNVRIEYPDPEDEIRIVRQTTAGHDVRLAHVVSRDQILQIRDLALRVPAADHVVRYAVNLARRTRPNTPDAPDFINQWVAWGAGPRAGQHLVLGAKARALLHGRNAISTDDIRALAAPVLRHRIIPNFSAEAEGIAVDGLVANLLDRFPPDKGKMGE